MLLPGGWDTHRAPAISRRLMAVVALTHRQRDCSDYTALPGLGRSLHCEPGCSSLDHATYPGAGMRLQRQSFLRGQTVLWPR